MFGNRRALCIKQHCYLLLIEPNSFEVAIYDLKFVRLTSAIPFSGSTTSSFYISLEIGGEILETKKRKYCVAVVGSIRNHYLHTNQSLTCHRRHNRHNPSLRAMSSYQSHLRDDDGLHEYCGNLRCQTIHWLSSHRSQKENQIVP